MKKIQTRVKCMKAEQEDMVQQIQIIKKDIQALVSQ